MGTSFGIGFGIKKSDPEKIRLIVRFKSNMQGVFTHGLIPFVPYNTFLLGITHRFNFHKKKNDKNN